MGILAWIQENWFVLLQSIGIVGGLVFTAVSLRQDARTRRVSNLIKITEAHRQIWTQLFQRPELARVLNAKADLRKKEITEQEELFIRLLILHLNSAFHALRDHVFVKPEGLQKDIRWFFTLPLPRVVWEKMKELQDAGFVAFVEACFGDGR